MNTYQHEEEKKSANNGPPLAAPLFNYSKTHTSTTQSLIDSHNASNQHSGIHKQKHMCIDNDQNVVAHKCSVQNQISIYKKS